MAMIIKSVELAFAYSYYVLSMKILVIMWIPKSPHWTKNMKPTTERLAQNVPLTGIRSRSASLIKVEIC